MSDVLERLGAALAEQYAIERELGAGGMATVYLARDLKHDRHVALKVLRPELAAVLGIERFLSEIRVTAHLQHPHILPLFDSGQAGGLIYYVMPHVEGESLRQRLERERQLPIEEAVSLATGVASALDYAHRHSVIHRDIKPENILFQDDQAVVADFGIALALSAAGGSRLTETGLSLGTPQYMSPEQATGDRLIDARSDIYSLASVLYEMLAGEPPHTGPTVQSVIAKVVTDRPRPLRQLRESVPPHVEAAVLKGLAKVPADRFQTAAQFVDALARPVWGGTLATTSPDAAAAEPGRPGRRAVRDVAPWAVAGLAAGLALWISLRARPEPPARPVARFTLVLPPSAPMSDVPAGTTVAMSPDGSRIIYLSAASTGNQLFSRTLDQLEPTSLTGTQNARNPFFSPDGRWVAYFSGTRLYKLPLGGGPALVVATVPGLSFGATWGANDTIVFVADRGLMAVPAAGGEPRLLFPADTSRGESYLFPHYMPDAKVLLLQIRTKGVDQLGALTLATGKLTRFEQAGSNPRYVSSGYVVVATRSGTLLAVPFDPSRLEITGSPLPVADGVVVGPGGAARMGMSRDGAFAYVTGPLARRDLVMVDRAGSARVLPAEPQGYIAPRLSPDGRRIAVEVDEPDLVNSDVWVYDMAQHTRTRLTFDQSAHRPIWTPDGKRIVYSRGQFSQADLYWIPADGTGPAESLLVAPEDQWAGDVTPDGRTLIFRSGGAGPVRSIHTLPLQGPRTPQPFLVNQFDNHSPSLSPDGHWVAYVSNESGRLEVYVRPFPGPGGRWQVSLDGGTEPLWAASGRELFYRNGTKMMVAATTLHPTFTVGARRELFEGSYVNDPVYRSYDVTRDGRGFVMVRSPKPMGDFVVVLNWFDQLRDQRRR
ncbi:MAG TPA: protein kinase [Gemmatimonadales bacterium]|nr:protein kinase [Gemmatimonadales bacterium]